MSGPQRIVLGESRRTNTSQRAFSLTSSTSKKDDDDEEEEKRFRFSHDIKPSQIRLQAPRPPVKTSQDSFFRAASSPVQNSTGSVSKLSWSISDDLSVRKSTDRLFFLPSELDTAPIQRPLPPAKPHLSPSLPSLKLDTAEFPPPHHVPILGMFDLKIESSGYRARGSFVIFADLFIFAPNSKQRPVTIFTKSVTTLEIQRPRLRKRTRLYIRIAPDDSARDRTEQAVILLSRGTVIRAIMDVLKTVPQSGWQVIDSDGLLSPSTEPAVPAVEAEPEHSDPLDQQHSDEGQLKQAQRFRKMRLVALASAQLDSQILERESSSSSSSEGAGPASSSSAASSSSQGRFVVLPNQPVANERSQWLENLHLQGRKRMLNVAKQPPLSTTVSQPRALELLVEVAPRLTLDLPLERVDITCNSLFQLQMELRERFHLDYFPSIRVIENGKEFSRSTYQITKQVADLSEIPDSALILLDEPPCLMSSNDVAQFFVFLISINSLPKHFSGSTALNCIISHHINNVSSKEDALQLLQEMLEDGAIDLVNKSSRKKLKPGQQGPPEFKADILTFYTIVSLVPPPSGEDRLFFQTLYAFGNGVSFPKAVPVLFEMKEVACGASHSCAISTEGRLWVWGNGRNGQLGIGEDTVNLRKPILVSSLHGRVTSISCSNSRSSCIVEESEIFLWGECNGTAVWKPTPLKELGRNAFRDQAATKFLDEEECTPLPSGLLWKRISVSSRNLLLLGEWQTYSQPFMCGDNSLGQLGHPSSIAFLQPTLVPGLLDHWITKTSRASQHYLALTKDGRLLSWGSNPRMFKSQQAALQSDDLFLPRLVTESEFSCSVGAIAEISSARDYHLLATRSGMLLGWGLPLVPNDERIHPVPGTTTSVAIERIAAARTHFLALGSDGVLWVSGEGNSGELGISLRSENEGEAGWRAPQVLDSIAPKRVIDLAAGTSNSCVIVEDNPMDLLYRSSVLKFGNNEFEMFKLAGLLMHSAGQFFLQQLKVLYPILDSGAKLQRYRDAVNSIASLSVSRYLGSLGEPAQARIGQCEYDRVVFSKHALEFGLYRSTKGGFRKQITPLPIFCYVTDSLTISNLCTEFSVPVKIMTSIDKSLAGMTSAFSLSFDPPFFSLPPATQIEVTLTLILFEPVTVAQLIPVEYAVGKRRFRSFLKICVEGSALTKLPEIPHAEISHGELIGSGATGSVLKVNFRGRTVAVKHYAHMLCRADYKEFRREVLIAGNCTHPNIARCLGVSTQPPRVSIVFKYYSRGDLATAVVTRPFPFELLLKTAIDISTGLLFLHSRRIIHRDLKPGNVLMVSFNPERKVCAKLTDFGGSTIFALHKTLSVEKGTVRYAAPELLGGSAYGPQVDVFSFAMTMCECLTRNVPFSELPFSSDVERRILSGGRPALPEASADGPTDDFLQLVKLCWEQDTNNRPSMRAVREILLAQSDEATRRRMAELATQTSQDCWTTSDEEDMDEEDDEPSLSHLPEGDIRDPASPFIEQSPPPSCFPTRGSASTRASN